MMEWLKYMFYFLIGGSVLVTVTYFGSKDKGILSAFIAMFPIVTTLSIVTIYSEAGNPATIGFLKGLIVLTPFWVLYIITVIYFLPKQGLLMSIALGVLIYLFLAVLIYLWF